MKRFGGRLVIFALCLGILIGLGIQGVKSYIAKTLIEMLSDEANSACNCTFAVDTVDVSLLTLSATARNPRIELAGKRSLWFKKINAYFSLNKLRERKVPLDLDLIDGFSDGFGEDSVTVRFIGSLAAPIPPERDRPGRWKLKLRELKVKGTTFEHSVAMGKIKGEGLSLDMQRDAANNFTMRPHVDALSVSIFNPDTNTYRTISLGNLAASFYLTDDQIDFERVKLALKNTFIETTDSSLTLDTATIDGKFAFRVDGESLPIKAPFQGAITGAGTLLGSATQPELQGKISIPANSELAIPADSKLIVADSLSGEIFGKSSDAGSSLMIKSLDASGKTFQIHGTELLSITGSKLTGKLSLFAEKLSIEDSTFEGVSGILTLGGSVTAPEITLNATVQKSLLHDVELPSLSLNLTSLGQRIEFMASHQRDGATLFSATGAVRLDNLTAVLEPSTVKIDRFPLGSPGQAHQGLVSGLLVAQGPITAQAIQAKGEITLGISNTPQSITGTFNAADGNAVFKGAGFNGSLEFEASAKLDETGVGSLVVKLQDFALASLKPSIDCTSINATLNYRFPLMTPHLGNGAVEIASAKLGCEPYFLTLKGPSKLPIHKGELTLSALEIGSEKYALKTSGTISSTKGLALNSEGSVELASMIGFFPAFDNMSGAVNAKIGVNGPFSEPNLAGTVAINDGSVWIESAGVAAEHVNGSLSISRKEIFVDHVTGEINSGTFEVSGRILPFDLGQSDISLQIRQATLEPQRNASLSVSGDLTLARAENGAPQIAGNIQLESGEIREQFDLQTILQMITEKVISRSKVAIPDRQLPSIGIDLHITGARNLFLLTNLAAGEFSANLEVNGTLASPTISGEIKTLSGWVGLKNRRFDITSGILTFSPSTPTPMVEVLGESNLPSRTGEYVLALLEVRGPLSNPTFRLTSDQGLSDREILALLTQSGTALRGTRANAISDLSEDSATGLLEDFASLNLMRFIRGLARIDSLGIEPVYNQQTGAIEPALVAEKRLARGLNLRGESAFGGTGSVSRAKVVYDLTRVLSAEGLVETDATKRTNPLEANLIYTILARQNKFVKITLSGNDEFSATTLLDAIHLSENSRVPDTDLPRIKSALESYYASQGYRESVVEVACNNINGFCSSLHLNIQELKPSLVSRIDLVGDPVPEAIEASLQKSLLAVPHRQIATTQFSESVRQQWLTRLRAEGYIGARVFADYKDINNSNDMVLVVELSAGRPVSFTFSGNRAFSPEDFLETINLFSRKQPFGNNTISILVQNIERLYRELGYLFATVGYEKTEDLATGRVNYIITITEEKRSKVEKIQFDGLSALTEAQLQARLARLDPNLPEEIWHPQAAVAEQLDGHCKDIEDVLIEAGFPDATAHAQILPDPSGTSVTIRYLLVEGQPLRASSISVEGLPEQVSTPTLPELPASIRQANAYLDVILSALKDAGYLRPEASLNMDPSTDAITISVTPGSRTLVRSIEVRGNSKISLDTINKSILLQPYSPWRQDQIDESRRTLLKLGLFSRVDFSPKDGKLDNAEEDLVVTVVERPLETLEVGAGANSEYGAHLFGEASDRSLFADGRSLAFRFDTYWDSVTSRVSQGVANLRYNSPNLLHSGLALTEDIRFQRLDLSTLPYNLDRISLASYLSAADESGLTYSFGHTIFQEDLTDVNAGSIISELDEGLERLSFLSGTVSYDQRDNPLNPTAGYFSSADYRVMAGAIGSDADLHAFSARGSWIQPISQHSPRVQVALNARVASAWTFGSTDQVPITQRYFLGGRTSVRGFKENSLGPRGDDGSIIGGDLLMMGNSELRWGMTDTTALHLFLDSGTTYLRDRSVSLRDLRYSTGVGLRYLSPIGPIGVDVGFPVDREPGESSYRLHFSIGNNF